MSKPRARTQELMIQDLDEEVVVYELDTHRVHSLAPEVAVVMRLADGTRTPREIAAGLGPSIPEGDRAAFVDIALAELAKAGLMSELESAPKKLAAAVTSRLAALAAVATVLTPQAVAYIKRQESEARHVSSDF